MLILDFLDGWHGNKTDSFRNVARRNDGNTKNGHFANVGDGNKSISFLCFCISRHNGSFQCHRTINPCTAAGLNGINQCRQLFGGGRFLDIDQRGDFLRVRQQNAEEDSTCGSVTNHAIGQSMPCVEKLKWHLV